MVRNISSLGYEVKDNKSWVDSKTEYVISTCSDDYNIKKQIGIFSKNEPPCAKTNDYEGACWVTNLGFTGGQYKAEVCYQAPFGYVQCKVLANGEVSGKFRVESKTLSYTDPYYTGSFKTQDDQDCPDYRHNINAFGYVYIKEATDKQYINAIDFATRFCQPLSEKYNSANCSPPQTCPCSDEECRANNFIPPKNSDVWKNASQKAKNCYLCLQKYRAVNYYCNKIYQCLNKDKKSYAYELGTSNYRKYLDEMYGEGFYLCGYYDGKLCGCGKSKLSAGPRHFLRVAKRTSSSCETREELINNPQCNLFADGVYARQFYNDYENHKDADCPYEINPEFGYKKRGTFFSPKITIVSGKNERLIGYNSSLLIGNEDFYYNSPIGYDIEYSDNNIYNFPIAKKIVFSNFYPVIFTIGATIQIKDDNGNCAVKPNDNISYIMLRMEYNFSTSESSLVAYRVRFLNYIPSQLTEDKSLLSDGSIAGFLVRDGDFIQTIKNAKNVNPDKEKMNIREFKYDYDPDLNFAKVPIPEKGQYLYFENIGKVVRPPLKYTYDEGSIYINSPIVLEQDLSIEEEPNGVNEQRLKLSIIPSNLSAFDGDEFLYDKELSTLVKKISVAGYNMEAFSLIDGTITNKSKSDISSEAIMYMKRFSVKYNNSCIFLKAMNSPGQEEYLLKNPPSNISECSGLTTLAQKMACLVSYMSLYECNGYVNCLDSEKSILGCQNENRRPRIKLLGTDSDLPEYKKNIDFRSYTQICIDEGFEFADRLSKYSNTKLFGDFGYAPYDYTIRWKKSGSGIASTTPGRPLSIRYSDVFNEPEEYQDRPKDIVTMDIDYFSSSESNRTSNMIQRLKSIHMVDAKSGMPSVKTVYDQYASDCVYNPNICNDRYEVKHRLINETLNSFCVSTGIYNNGTWDLVPRDLGIDYNIYIPLRCQYVYFNGTGAGGAGFTTEEYSNCLVQYHVIENAWSIGLVPPYIVPMPFFPSGAYLRTPKFDATGSRGGSVSTKINLNLLPVFDGYLHVTTGTRTMFTRAKMVGKQNDDPEKCFTGVSPYAAVDHNTRDWMVKGGTHGFWFLNYNASIKKTNSDAYLVDNTSPVPGVTDVEKYYDYRKGNSEIAFDTHGAEVSSHDEQGHVMEQYEFAKQTLENLLNDDFITLIETDKTYRILEFYFVSLMHLSYRLQYIDDALFSAQSIALDEIKKKYQNDLNYQNNLKRTKEDLKNELQERLDGLLPFAEECESIDPETGRTISGKTREECDEIDSTIEDLKGQIRILINEISSIQQEINRLTDVIDNNAYPDDEIKNFDISSSSSIQQVETLINSINDEIDNEKNSWIGDSAFERRSVSSEENEITNIQRNYGDTDVLKLNNIIDKYKESISSVSDIKRSHCNSLTSIQISPINIINIETAKKVYERQFSDLLNRMLSFNEFTGEKNSINKLFNSCKQHTEEIIDAASKKPESYYETINFRHANNYGLLKSLMCLSFDVSGTSCNELASILAHNKMQDSVNLCEVTRIVTTYSEAKELLYKNNSTIKDTVCYKKDPEDPENYIYCTQGEDDCECKDIDTSGTERITDAKINSNTKILSDKFSVIKEQVNIIKNLEKQLEEISSRTVEPTNTNYQYLATALRGSSPIDARIKRYKHGQGNVPYWDGGDETTFGVATFFQAELGGRVIDDRVCCDTGLFDVAYIHDYICLNQKGWIEGKRNLVLNDGYGYANKDYTFDTSCNSQSVSRSSTISTELDHRAALGSYEKYEGMSGDGSGSGSDHNAVKGKWNNYEENQSAGGSFHHLQGAGGGGPGSTTVSLSLIGIKQFEYNGEKFPELNDDGTKKVINQDTPDSRCIIKCPPMNLLIKDFDFYFPEIGKTSPIDMVCEYSGEPEQDMEVIIGTTVTPKKCYILTESVAGVGYVKGKIIISSDGVCPIAKCANGSWGFNARPGISKIISQYDRNTGICMPFDEYGDEKKTSKYFMMMFDKNVYSGFAYKGSRTSSLTAMLPQYIDGKWKGNSYVIANCSNTKIGGYIIDTYDQLLVLGKSCITGGFWFENNASSVQPLFPKREYIGTCMTDKDEYDNACKISNVYDEKRNLEYTGNNNYWNEAEYLVKDVNYILGKKNGNEFSKAVTTTDVSVSGIHSVSNVGRTVFKDRIKCPMIDADKYDFDNDYSGNAIWDFADENSTVTALRCKEDSIQMGSSLPTRTCKTNGLWGPVMSDFANSCFSVCKEDIDTNGTKWIITKEDIAKLHDGEMSITVSGACSENYLNSQDYNRETGVRTRTCNLLTGKWGQVLGPARCNDGLITIDDNYNNRVVSTPYARTMIFTKSNQYQELLDFLNSGAYKMSEYTEYKDGLYLVFAEGKKYSSVFDSDYYYTDNDYVDVKIEEKNFDLDGDVLITDRKGNRLIDKLPNNDYYVISVYNTLDIEPFKYMLANGNDTRNEFLNIENWMSILKEDKMNFTGQWSWKANLSKAKSITVKDSTLKTAQEIYKNAKLIIFIPKLIDSNKNLQHIALFSPFLAKTMGAGSDIVPVDEENIKFRFISEIDSDYLINNKQYAITVYDGISSSSRLFRFEWEKGDEQDWFKNSQVTHKIGARNCNGKYFGYIKHNTTKHVMYTPEPTNSNQVFASLFCYDGRIFGFHAFRSNIYQSESLTDGNTKSILLEKFSNDYSGAEDSYNIMKDYFSTLDLKNDYFSDSFDIYCEGAKNAYLFAMMARYWQAHILPTDEEQINFINDYGQSDSYNITNVIKNYSNGSNGRYYRILPRKVDWINGLSAVETIDYIYDIAKIDENDPYCNNTKCLEKKQLFDRLNEKVIGII